MNVTGAILKKLVSDLSFVRSDSLAEISNQLCIKYGINDPGVYHEFIANVLAETDGFYLKKESMNYTHPERLVEVWPSRFALEAGPGKLDAFEYIAAPAKLAEAVYGGRMGNIQKGDAYMFIGGGFAQITGRDAYTLYTKFVNARNNTKYTIAEIAKLVQTDDTWAFDSAFWFFCEFKNLEQFAMEDKMLEVVKRWNGGTIGLAKRMRYYNQAKRLIV